ncbi:hypothetical protein V8G54_022883 [Vigna mungo]|uniref:3-oxo-5-alpha-steroid 4-dehydrogenase C-terminal domain-containing protein n=1 Tax=Vigna mungo TaxID=3915 RepID=A0AAQ3N413_VIGMU
MRFYIAAPLSLCGDCAVEVFNFVANLVTEFIVKGKNQMQVTELDIWQVLTPLIRLGWKHWIAVAVFLWGWIHQYHCHKILVANLSFAAVETHKWYRQKFKDYPSNRFAIIPFLL